MGVTSSITKSHEVTKVKEKSKPILPIFNPERAKARRADWAPGPGVLVRFPPYALKYCQNKRGQKSRKVPQFDVDSGHSHIFASLGHILGSLHCRVRRRLVTIGLDFHSTGHSTNGFFSRQISHMLQFLSNLTFTENERRTMNVSLNDAKMWQVAKECLPARVGSSKVGCASSTLTASTTFFDRLD